MTEIEVTHCDKCNTELEEGQTGVCDDCREYTFAELSETAKDKARDNIRYTEHYLDYEWWDSTCEDAARIATILGLDVEDTIFDSKFTTSHTRINISFSGFSSQGDGACFEGRYTFNPKSVKEIKAYCNDEELIRIATELHAMQITERLMGREYFGAKITTSGRYSHSHTMSCEMTSEDSSDERQPEETDEGQFAQLMRDFAGWIYSTLEDEHDHLMSDEVVDGQFTDEKFDESGSII